MPLFRASIFLQFSEIKFGLSTRFNGNDNSPFGFNLSYSVGDEPDNVAENRKIFFLSLGIEEKNIKLQKQIHSDSIEIIESKTKINESDAMITAERGIGLAVSFADCVPIFLYDHKIKIIAAVHSGWKGTKDSILMKTVDKMINDFDSIPTDIYAYIAPSINKENYEVNSDVADFFNNKFLLHSKSKFLLDLRRANLDMLLDSGVPSNNIQISNLCTFRNDKLFHSYRRDGTKSGRAIGIIAMKEEI